MKTSPLLIALALIASPLFAAPTEKTEPVKARAPQAPAPRVSNGTPDDVAKLIASNPKVTILDVRTPREFADGHIEGAKNISSVDPDFDEKIAALDPTQPIVLHCAAGGRSGQVLPKVEALKVPSILHMNGGFRAWKEAGKPVVK